MSQLNEASLRRFFLSLYNEANVKVSLQDSTSRDAFGRLRISDQYTQFDNKQLFERQDHVWISSSVNGASVVYDASRVSTTISASTTSGSLAIVQSKKYFFYQPGKSNLCHFTFKMDDGAVGIRKRIGLFDQNDGIFLEQSGTSAFWVLRSSIGGTVVDSRIEQSSWDVDTFDGRGPSGHQINLAKTQLAFIDYQWLGVGRVRVGFGIEGEDLVAHEFLNNNSKYTAYMKSPNLAFRYEIENLVGGNTGTLEQICFAVGSEGGIERSGDIHAADRGSTGISFNSGSAVPVISLRINSNRKGTNLIIDKISLLCSTGANFRYGLYLNPTISGSDGANWQSVSGSNIQFDISRNSTNIVSQGILLRSGYASSQAGSEANLSELDLRSEFLLGQRNLSGTMDELVVAVEHFEAGSETFLSAINWREFV